MEALGGGGRDWPRRPHRRFSDGMTDTRPDVSTSETAGCAALPPVLVTGMHRSGTSWLGEILSAGGDLTNIGEPLNVLNRQTIFPRRVTYWYTHITGVNEREYLPYYRDAAMFKIHPLNDIRRMRFGSPRDPYRIAHRWASFVLGRLQGRRLLIKDPFAVFSIDWFVRQLNCGVVVIVRHPVAVVSSLKSLRFSFEFSNLLQQPTLMEGPLKQFQAPIEAAASDPHDLVGHGSLLWRLIYEPFAVATGSTTPIVVRHEDLSTDVLRHCASLYQTLGLAFTSQAQEAILASSRAGNPTELSRRHPYKTKLDSRANLGNWRRRLEPAEVNRIVEITEPAVSRLYPEGLDVLGAAG
jgi:hypothetical protein